MYSVCKAFTKAIRGRSRSVHWRGTITATDGTVLPFDNTQIVENSGTLSKLCSSQSSIDLGGVYASEVTMSLRLDTNRYRLPDAKIALFIRLDYLTDINTWEDAANESFTWEDMKSCKWGDSPKRPYLDVPMGVFTVSEVLRTANSVKITAYDSMVEFDRTLPTISTEGQFPYYWLKWICQQCGVSLGMTEKEVAALPNGRRTMVYATVDEQITTCRDLLSALTTALGAVALIDRTGALVLKRYGTEPAETIGADFRYSSDFSDYQSYYTGLYATYNAEGIQEYYTNAASDEDDTGLTMDIGSNPFLQFSDKKSRTAAMKSLINGQKDRKYIPFNVTMPLNPVYDLMDVVQFTGNQAGENDIAPITSITYKMGDKMTIQCTGENPRLSSAQTKENKLISGLTGSTSLSPDSALTGTDIWIKHGAFPTAQTTISEDTVISKLEFESTVDNTRLQITWTGAFSADADTQVYAEVYVDGISVYSVCDTVLTGANRVLTVMAGYDIKTKGEHTIEIHVRGENNTE